MIELPGVTEDGMSGRNGQRKPGTTRGSPRRSRTAKASRISRHAVKSRCARGWGGWGRLSDDGSRQHNSGQSEDPWGGELPHLHGGARLSGRPDTAREYRNVMRCAKGGHKPHISQCMPGAGLSWLGAGRCRPKCQPSSRIGENPPYGMIGRVEETSASCEARSAPRLYPTAGGRGAILVPTATSSPRRAGAEDVGADEAPTIRRSYPCRRSRRLVSISRSRPRPE
jgi:hypothetical protein